MLIPAGVPQLVLSLDKPYPRFHFKLKMLIPAGVPQLVLSLDRPYPRFHLNLVLPAGVPQPLMVLPSDVSQYFHGRPPSRIWLLANLTWWSFAGCPLTTQSLPCSDSTRPLAAAAGWNCWQSTRMRDRPTSKTCWGTCGLFSAASLSVFHLHFVFECLFLCSG